MFLFGFWQLFFLLIFCIIFGNGMNVAVLLIYYDLSILGNGKNVAVVLIYDLSILV